MLCLDGADLTYLADAQRVLDLPALTAALGHARPLPSTAVPQTPVAWTSLLCGAEPELTGVWGWYRCADGRADRLGAGDLPAAGLDWNSHRVLLAGLPYLPAAAPPGSVSTIAGLRGPTKHGGGSRPAIRPGMTFDQVCQAWQDHHRTWASTVTARIEEPHELVLVHCDSVDWFSHRFGPGSERGRSGWRLADALLERLLGSLSPEQVVVLSDHGSAPVSGFVRVHEALFRAGLSACRPADGATLADLAAQPVFCGSDYGALWINDPDLVGPAHEVLVGLGAESVTRPEGAGAPTLLPRWRDGWLALMPPELDPGDADEPLVVADGPEFDRLRALNWMGDHARDGLIGTPDPAVGDSLAGLSIAELKPALLQLSKG